MIVSVGVAPALSTVDRFCRRAVTVAARIGWSVSQFKFIAL
jgi:hypothetical protein